MLIKKSFKKYLSISNSDTPEVKQAKDEFFKVFSKALNGMIEVALVEDTQEVREKKEAFLRTFDAAVDDLFDTVEGFYTPEQVSARKQFREAFVKCKKFMLQLLNILWPIQFLNVKLKREWQFMTSKQF